MRIRSLLILATVLMLAAAAGAQTSSLRGTVTDPNGLVVAGAEVVLLNPATGYSRTDATEPDGTYQFLQVPPGTYNLTVTSSGFAVLKEEGVVLQVNVPALLDLRLKVAAETTTVEVRGEAALVNTQDATLGHAFDTKQIDSLPFEGREAESILSLQPGVVFLGRNLDTTSDSRSGAVAGARSDQSNFTLDGLDNNMQLTGDAFTGVLRTPLDAIQEFRVTTTQANADAGRSSGAQVTLVTKTGTNNWHGGGYYWHRPTLGVANDWFIKHSQEQSGEPNQPFKFLRNTFGANLGGPIKKDKLFFFAAWEAMRKRESLSVTRVVPSDDLRRGLVTYRCDATDPLCPAGGLYTINMTTALVDGIAPSGAVIDPLCTANGTCPLGPGANPEVMSLWQSAYPSPNNDSLGDGFNFRGYTFGSANPVNENTYLLRLDYRHSDRHNFFVRGNLMNDHEEGASQFPGLPSNRTVTANNKGIAVSWAAILTDHFINNFRYGFIREGSGISGINRERVTTFRGLDYPFGPTRSTHAIVPVHNFIDDVSWSKGKHTLQFGTNWRFISNARMSDASSFGRSVTNSSWLDAATLVGTGDSLDPGAFGFPAVDSSFENSYNFPVAALTGLLVQVDTVYNQDKTGAVLPEGDFVPRKFRSFEAEFYIQDSWRIKPNFTVTFGLRYSLLQPPYEVNGNQVAPNISLNDWFNRRWAAMLQGQSVDETLELDISGQANGGKPYWEWDKANFAPRISFAYSPNFDSGVLGKVFGGPGRTSIRGGWGLYHDHFGQGVVNTFDQNGSFGLTTNITNPAGLQNVNCVPRYAGYANPAGLDCNGDTLGAPAPGAFPVTPPTGYDNGSFAIYWGLDDRLKTPYSQAFNFSFTRELTRNLVFEASYVGRLGQRLLAESDLAMPLNIVDPSSGVDYFTAATLLSQMGNAGTPVTDVQPIPYFENLFGDATGGGLLGGWNPVTMSYDGTYTCAPEGTYVQGSGAPLSATQNMYDNFFCFLNNETTALFLADLYCWPACADLGGGGAPFQFFDDQFSSLWAWRTLGRSYYHSGQFSLRQRMSHGIQFDFNYTWSKSVDNGSNSERINGFESPGNAAFNSQVINSWSPYANRSVSDFDTTHQINANWIWELPLGKGRAVGTDWKGVAQAMLGGWQLSGLYRWTSGFPFSISSGANWATNWQLGSNAVLTGARPGSGVYADAGGEPNAFSDPEAVHNAFRYAFPGEVGDRNILRGPGYFNVDLGLSKTWQLSESQRLKFSWEVFNLTNSVRFDAASMGSSLDSIESFGRYNTTVTLPRVMQFGLRWEF